MPSLVPESPAAHRKPLVTSSADQREERLARSLDLSNDGYIHRIDFETALEAAGIRPDDPRLVESMAALRTWEKENRSIARRGFPREVFALCIRQNILLIERALQGNLIIPDWQTFCEEIEELYTEVHANRDGAPAQYIPQLRLEEPAVDSFGLSICTVDGQRCSFGDSDVWWTAQSTCKPVNYCLALEEHGEEEVHRYIGREPSGASFNEIKLNAKNQPHNPLINAGAIMACSLIQLSERRKALRDKGETLRGWAGERFDYVLGRWKELAGGMAPRFSNSVYLSERETADRNFALGHFMREQGSFPRDSDLHDVLELYFQCCSIEVNTELLGMVAATLANGGVCPVSGERILSTRTVQNCLSLMYSCGMYDFSGEFAFTIGLPAKSGVSGGLWVIVPNVMGMCIWSPRLDAIGNSVRGVSVCEKLVSRYNFHNYDIIAGQTDKQNPRVNHIQAKADHTNALIWAASKGDVSAMQREITLGADLNYSDYDGRTPLHLAAAEGQVAIVQFFLKQKNKGVAVDLDALDRRGGTPLDDATDYGHERIVALLEGAGAKRGTPAPASGHPPTDNAALATDPRLIVEMNWAAYEGDIGAIQRLVARGVPFDCADYDFRTPLHLAAAEGHIEIVRYFLAYDTMRVPRDRWGGTPLDDAERHGQTECAALLREGQN